MPNLECTRRKLTCLMRRISQRTRSENFSSAQLEITHRRNSDSSLELVFSRSSILFLRFASAVFEDLLASEWAKWFMRMARNSAALRKRDEVCGNVSQLES